MKSVCLLLEKQDFFLTKHLQGVFPGSKADLPESNRLSLTVMLLSYSFKLTINKIITFIINHVRWAKERLVKNDFFGCLNPTFCPDRNIWEASVL